jgi:H+/Cl- antiporter ClcA
MGLSRLMWKRRIVFVAGALGVGVAAVIFAVVADRAQHIYQALLKQWPWSPLILTPAVFAALAYVVRTWFPHAQGSGIPQVIAARASREHHHRAALLSWRTAAALIVLTTIAMAGGASVGRQGPTVLVGAALLFGLAGVAGMGRARGLALAGAAGGIAAAFNSPLAGVVFAIEELAKTYEGRVNVMIISSVVIAGLVSWLTFGQYHHFGEIPIFGAENTDWLAVLVCAVFGGVFGGLFARSLVTAAFSPPVLLARLRAHRVLFAAGAGLVVAVLSIATHGYASGSGYAEARSGLVYGELVPWWFGFAKLVATLLSSLATLPGGLFAPSLAVGAGLGSAAAPLVPFVEPRVLVLLMMAGYFAAVVQSPLTVMVIVMEMTSAGNMVTPLLATTLLASIMSRLINREPLYHALARNFAVMVEGTAQAGATSAGHRVHAQRDDTRK